MEGQLLSREDAARSHARVPYVVPRGVEHCPVAEKGAEVLLIERVGTPNTGDVGTAAVRREI